MFDVFSPDKATPLSIQTSMCPSELVAPFLTLGKEWCAGGEQAVQVSLHATVYLVDALGSMWR